MTYGIVSEYMQAHPSAVNLTAVAIITVALAKQFPCAEYGLPPPACSIQAPDGDWPRGRWMSKNRE